MTALLYSLKNTEELYIKSSNSLTTAVNPQGGGVTQEKKRYRQSEG